MNTQTLFNGNKYNLVIRTEQGRNGYLITVRQFEDANGNPATPVKVLREYPDHDSNPATLDRLHAEYMEIKGAELAVTATFTF